MTPITRRSSATEPPASPTTRPRPSLHLVEPGSSFRCKLDSGAYSACSSPKTTAHLADGPHTFYVRAKDSAGTSTHPGDPHLHRPHRLGQGLGLGPRGHRRARSEGQPSDHPALRLDRAGHRLPRRRLHGLGRPHGSRLHPKRRLHRQLPGRRDHPGAPGAGHLRRSTGRQGGQLDRAPKLALRRRGERHADGRLGQGHPERRSGRRRAQRDWAETTCCWPTTEPPIRPSTVAAGATRPTSTCSPWTPTPRQGLRDQDAALTPFTQRPQRQRPGCRRRQPDLVPRQRPTHSSHAWYVVSRAEVSGEARMTQPGPRD